MTELESLSNKELRQKCMEYGMPNVPVTDSSRKILIRRLEAIMSGKPVKTTPAKSNRRETVHVSKLTEVASSPKITVNSNETKAFTPNTRPSRRTIAVAERHVTTTTTVSEPEYSDVSPDRFEPEPVRAQTKTPEKPPTLYPKLPTKEPSPKPQFLSKTGVVTTSYVQETTPITKTYADEVDLIEINDIAEEEPIKKTVSVAPKFSYVPVSEPKVTTTAPLTTSGRYGLVDNYTNYNKASALTTSNTRKSYIPPSSNYGKSTMASQYARSYDAELEDDFEDDEDEVVLVEESPSKDVETPFLSQFARNLENLKATPIRHSVGPTRISPSKYISGNRDDAYIRRTIASPATNINPRRTIKPIHNKVDSPLRQFMLGLEEKYHLKHTLILISIFILAVFIYVFFIQSV